MKRVYTYNVKVDVPTNTTFLFNLKISRIYEMV